MPWERWKCGVRLHTSSAAASIHDAEPPRRVAPLRRCPIPSGSAQGRTLQTRLSHWLIHLKSPLTPAEPGRNNKSCRRDDACAAAAVQTLPSWVRFSSAVAGGARPCLCCSCGWRFQASRRVVVARLGGDAYLRRVYFSWNCNSPRERVRTKVGSSR